MRRQLRTGIRSEQFGTFDDKNAGTDKLVTATFSLAGIDAGNYALASDTATTT